LFPHREDGDQLSPKQVISSLFIVHCLKHILDGISDHLWLFQVVVVMTLLCDDQFWLRDKVDQISLQLVPKSVGLSGFFIAESGVTLIKTASNNNQSNGW
jgi:hypothetical protein